MRFVHRCLPPGHLGLLSVACLLLWASATASAQSPGTGLEAAVALEKVLVKAIEDAEDSVVAIARMPKQQPLGLPRPLDSNVVPSGYGTGVVIDADGLILTNYHVLGDIEKNDYYVWRKRRVSRVTDIRADRELEDRKLEDAERTKARKVVAADPWLDLAVLQIDADDLKPIRFGDAGTLKKGQIVIALGNPYAIARDGEISASWGIISNLKRQAPPPPGEEPVPGKDATLHQYGTLIQTDARLPQGASGGALVNLRGEMIGLTSSLAALSNGETTAGFAIPVDDRFKRVVETLKAGRRADFGFLGVSSERLVDDARRGETPAVRIDQVVPGTPAARARLRPSDYLTHVDGVPVESWNDLIREVSGLPVGRKVRLSVIRDGRRIPDIEVTLGKKYLNTSRPSYGKLEEPLWRGMRVDYATAVPPEIFQTRALELGWGECVAVCEIEPDSPAWKAGLRRWTYISHVGDKPALNPEVFYDLVAGRTGPVELRLSGAGGKTVTVPAP